MSKQDKLYIAATGMITPVGMNTDMTLASVKAGINVYQNSSFINKDQYRMKLAQVPDEAFVELNENINAAAMSGQEKRMLCLASSAVSQVYELFSPSKPIPLFLAAPESIPGKDIKVSEHFIENLQRQTGVAFDQANSVIVNEGRAAGLKALDLIFNYMENSESKYALLVGVDSYVDASLLSALDEENRVLTEVSTNGFAPGEAATAILLIHQRVLEKSPDAIAAVARPGVAEEKGHRYSQEPMLGDGLADAVRGAIDGSNNIKIDSIYSSFNGESFHSKEYGVAMMRNSASLVEGYKHEHPADCFGDLGAAFAPTLMAIAARTIEADNSDYASLVFCASEKSLRGAICLNKI
ncbi:hypothetical protein FLL45_00060 [Aliikangiella marina]|uniref:Beta-ketoacyl synthase N-terminal domain-containing protein n=1 Tax=Aliikangiella marina TaxID=1712262 RepID=A0A545TGN9_9GAMM|nr:hypothetical protein [Aliikangiella marina]TQV76397.1 hypothetical protein FLL45_00060 [Aliikangiella marina]